MKLGLHISNFSWPGGPATLRQDLKRVVLAAEAGGFDRVSVMDHVWQIDFIGPPESAMLEAYTTLGYLAGVTSRIRLLTLVTGVVYREPGLLAKMVTTLDVVSGGRAMLGIGAAWNEDEARAVSGCPSLRRPSASNGWKRRFRSAFRCGAAKTDPTTERITTSKERSTRRTRSPLPTLRS